MTAKDLKNPASDTFKMALSIAMYAVRQLPEAARKELTRKTLRRLMSETKVAVQKIKVTCLCVFDDHCRLTIRCVVHVLQKDKFGWRIYKSVRNRIDHLLRAYATTFKSFFLYRNMGKLFVSEAACALLKNWGITEGKNDAMHNHMTLKLL